MKITKEDMIKMVPFVAPIFILFGIVNAAVYYGVFGINILNYATWNEYLFFFLNDLPKLYIMLLLIPSALFLLPIFGNKIVVKLFIIFDTVVGILLFILDHFSNIKHLFFTSYWGTHIIYIFCFVIFDQTLAFLNSESEFKNILDSPITLLKNYRKIPYNIAFAFLGFLLIAPPYIDAFGVINHRMIPETLFCSSASVIMDGRG